MIDLSASLEALVADARRAAQPGSFGFAVDRAPGTVALPSSSNSETRFVPSSLQLAVAIAGPGYFVVSDGRDRLFTRLGDFRIDERGALVDGRGRAVLGFFNSGGAEASGALRPLRVSARDLAAFPASHYGIDARGTLYRCDARVADSHATRIALGRIALAVFPSPEHLRVADDTALSATAAAGEPMFFKPGASGVATLRDGVLASSSVDLAGDLAALWRIRRRGENDAAVAYSRDACDRTALDLVK
jgi:flagellar hook protein FlgE